MLPFLECMSVGVTSVLLTSTTALGPQPVSGDYSAKRPNKSPFCGVRVVGRCEGNNREDEVGVLSVGEFSGGSSNAGVCPSGMEEHRGRGWSAECR